MQDPNPILRLPFPHFPLMTTVSPSFKNFLSSPGLFSRGIAFDPLQLSSSIEPKDVSSYSKYLNELIKNVFDNLNHFRFLKRVKYRLLNSIYNRNYFKIEKSKICKKLNIKKENFILASIHREENLRNIEDLKSGRCWSHMRQYITPSVLGSR